MKKLLIILILAVTAWVSYLYSQGSFKLRGDWPPSSFSTPSAKSSSAGSSMALTIEKGEGKEGEEEISAAERFHSELKPYQDYVFANITGKSRKAPSIGNVLTSANMELNARGGDRNAARLALQISRSLQKVAKERAVFEQEVVKLQSTKFRSLNKRNPDKKKKFFEDEIKRRWNEYVSKERPRIDRMMNRLRALK